MTSSLLNVSVFSGELFGEERLEKDEMPPVETPTMNTIGFYMHKGGRGPTSSDWNFYVKLFRSTFIWMMNDRRRKYKQWFLNPPRPSYSSDDYSSSDDWITASPFSQASQLCVQDAWKQWTTGSHLSWLLNVLRWIFFLKWNAVYKNSFIQFPL